MSRPLRLQFPGSLWHITHCGNERRSTFYQDADRIQFLELLGEAVRRFKWIVTAYALMPDRYEVLAELTEAKSLSAGLKWLNGTYTSWFNRHHRRVGRVFMARFRSCLIDKEMCCQEVLRGVVLNPVRVKLTRRPEDYNWTSYAATAGIVNAPEWLAVDEVLNSFADDHRIARRVYRRYVAEGIRSSRDPWNNLIGGMYLGSTEWLESIRQRVEALPRSNDHIRAQRELLRPRMRDVIGAVAEVMSVAEDVIRRGRGGIPRMIAAWIGRYDAMLPNVEIGAPLNLRSDSRVTALAAECERELRTNDALRGWVDRAIATLRRKK